MTTPSAPGQNDSDFQTRDVPGATDVWNLVDANGQTPGGLSHAMRGCISILLVTLVCGTVGLLTLYAMTIIFP